MQEIIIVVGLPYDAHFDAKNNDLRLKNTFYWDILYEYSNT